MKNRGTQLSQVTELMGERDSEMSLKQVLQYELNPESRNTFSIKEKHDHASPRPYNSNKYRQSIQLGDPQYQLIDLVYKYGTYKGHSEFWKEIEGVYAL